MQENLLSHALLDIPGAPWLTCSGGPQAGMVEQEVLLRESEVDSVDSGDVSERAHGRDRSAGNGNLLRRALLHEGASMTTRTVIMICMSASVRCVRM